jgi:hypothetical protein
MKRKDVEDIELMLDMLLGKPPKPEPGSIGERIEQEKQEYLNKSEEERDEEDEDFLRKVKAVFGEKATTGIRDFFGTGEPIPLVSKAKRLQRLDSEFAKLINENYDNAARVKDLKHIYDEERRKILES